jgi:hypothetical protein
VHRMILTTLCTEFKVRVRTHQKQKERAHSARVADAGQGNIETVHAPRRIQAADTL